MGEGLAVENIRSIRTRIKSIESTRQITRSLKMISASKLRRTQTAATALREFADQSRKMLDAVLAAPGRVDNPFLCPRKESSGRVLYVVFVGNRGLCGSYHSALVKYLRELIRADGREPDVVVCGRWGRELFAASRWTVLQTFDCPDTPVSGDARELTEFIKERYAQGLEDSVVLVYQQFRSVLSQTPGHRVLFPLETGGSGSGDPVIFEPDRGSLLDALAELTVSNTVFAAMLEAKAGEHAARMAAMTAASDNTDELIQRLSLELNHARQSAITTEIAEIAGGAAALEKT